MQNHSSFELDLPAMMDLIFNVTTQPEEWQYFGRHSFDLCCKSYAAEVQGAIERHCGSTCQRQEPEASAAMAVEGATVLRVLPNMTPYLQMLGM